MRRFSHCAAAAVGSLAVIGAFRFLTSIATSSPSATCVTETGVTPRADARGSTKYEALDSALSRMIVDDARLRLGDKALADAAGQYFRPTELPLPQLCFAPDTPDEIIEMHTEFGGPRYFQISRWSTTASGNTGAQGDPITLTYSFPPDGTTIPQISGVSFPSGINDFNDWLDGIYGSQAVWQPIIEGVFARWSTVCGVTYIYEPNDDGAETNFSPGILGVRGDLRICGKLLDGNSGVLAYNNFPNDGDMVFDTGDNFFDNTANSSLRLRNVAAHEHGHGMGQLHVCPLDEIKLMEPIASTAFNGPQHDDIRNAHRHYGDSFEPDNAPAQATDLGTPTIPSTQTIGVLTNPVINFGATISIDANGEQDFFRFTATEPVLLTVTATPIGTTYTDAPQQCGGSPASCCSNTVTNSLTIADLAVQVLASNGSTVLATGEAAPIGTSETLNEVLLESAGDYYIRVYETNTPTQTQLYRLTVTLADVPFLPIVVSLPEGAPAQLDPGVATSFDVEIRPNDDTIVPGSARLFYRYQAGPYSSTLLVPIGGDLYEATLPAANCGDEPEFFVQAEGTMSGVDSFPDFGATNPLTAIVGDLQIAFADNGESDQGWTVSGTASDGQWQRGIPENNGRGDPPNDFDASGQCWLTDNDPNTSNSDVDNGSTILTSPVIDVAGNPDATVAYARWFDNTAGDSPNADTMIVEVSSNGGGSWTTLETIGPATAESAGGWFAVEFAISDFVPVTSQFRIRFTASDLGAGSVVEAAIDAVEIGGLVCEDVMTPPPAPTGVAATDGSSCDDVTISWSAVDGADDYEVYRNSVNDTGTATQIAVDVIGLSFVDTTATPGATSFYWVKACNIAGCSAFSATDTGSRAGVPTDAPSATATIDTLCGAIELNWNAVGGATQYRIFRNESADFETSVEIEVVSPPTDDYMDVTVLTETDYFYWVVAENTCGLADEGNATMGRAAIRGDFNLDGDRDGLDIDGMVQALLGDSTAAACADLAEPAGTIDAADVSAFVSILLAP